VKKIINRTASFFTIICISVLFITINLIQPPEIFSKTNKTIKNQLSARETLQKYIELRLMDSHWKEYSQYITWPDEPSWDCKWVVSNYDIGPSKKQKGKIIIPVVYMRLGLYCVGDEDFNHESKKVTINYELVKNTNGWKINSEISDYPEISADILVIKLRTSAKKETPERQIKIETIVGKIKK